MYNVLSYNIITHLLLYYIILYCKQINTNYVYILLHLDQRFLIFVTSVPESQISASFALQRNIF